MNSSIRESQQSSITHHQLFKTKKHQSEVSVNWLNEQEQHLSSLSLNRELMSATPIMFSSAQQQVGGERARDLALSRADLDQGQAEPLGVFGQRASTEVDRGVPVTGLMGLNKVVDGHGMNELDEDEEDEDEDELDDTESSFGRATQEAPTNLISSVAPSDGRQQLEESRESNRSCRSRSSSSGSSSGSTSISRRSIDLKPADYSNNSNNSDMFINNNRNNNQTTLLHQQKNHNSQQQHQNQMRNGAQKHSILIGSNTMSSQQQRHQQQLTCKEFEDVKEVELFGVLIVALTINGKERLCLAQISNTLLKEFSYNEIHNRRVALGITCIQCTPIQLEMLRRAGAMPSSSRRCGMITMREAERLCRSFLVEEQPPELPENFYFTVAHRVNYGCKGRFVPARYISSRAKCIECFYCGEFYSPNKFIFHSHRQPHNTDCNPPDSPNINSWRKHIDLDWSQEHGQEIKYAWEDVKSLFNGGTRRRAPNNNSANNHQQSSTGGSILSRNSTRHQQQTGDRLENAGKSSKCNEDELIDVVVCNNETTPNILTGDINLTQKQKSHSTGSNNQTSRRKFNWPNMGSNHQSKYQQHSNNSSLHLRQSSSSGNSLISPSSSSTLNNQTASTIGANEPSNRRFLPNLKRANSSSNTFRYASSKRFIQSPSTGAAGGGRVTPAPPSGYSSQALTPMTMAASSLVADPAGSRLTLDQQQAGGAHDFLNSTAGVSLGRHQQQSSGSCPVQAARKMVQQPLAAPTSSSPYQLGSAGSLSPTNFIYSQLYNQLIQPHQQQQQHQQQQLDAQLALRHHIWSSLLANLQCNMQAPHQTYNSSMANNSNSVSGQQQLMGTADSGTSQQHLDLTQTTPKTPNPHLGNLISAQQLYSQANVMRHQQQQQQQQQQQAQIATNSKQQQQLQPTRPNQLHETNHEQNQTVLCLNSQFGQANQTTINQSPAFVSLIQEPTHKQLSRVHNPEAASEV